MKLLKDFRTVSMLLFLVLALALHVGCSQDSGSSPVGPERNAAPLDVITTAYDEEAEEDDDDLDFLTVAQRDPAEDGVSTAEIGLAGGVLTHAAHRLVVPPGALNETLELSFSMPLSDTLTFDLGPHGTQFNVPVSLVFNYGNADLTAVNESLLQVYYYDPGTQIFEPIFTTVDTVNNVVIGYTNHFSRYALIRK